MAGKVPAPLRRALDSGRRGVQQTLRFGKRMSVALAGGAVTLAGGAMLVLPGPGVLTVALGLAILSLEFERPRGWLAQMKARGVELKDQLVAHRRRKRHDS